MCCESCGLFYIVMPEVPEITQPAAFAEVAEAGATARIESEQTAGEMVRLATRARELSLVEPEVEEREGKWRDVTSAERLTDLRFC